jgi:hypothetical protein
MAYLGLVVGALILWALWSIGRTLTAQYHLLIEISRRLKETGELLEERRARRAG